mgnify:CR=1 FL=1
MSSDFSLLPAIDCCTARLIARRVDLSRPNTKKPLCGDTPERKYYTADDSRKEERKGECLGVVTEAALCRVLGVLVVDVALGRQVMVVLVFGRVPAGRLPRLDVRLVKLVHLLERESLCLAQRKGAGQRGSKSEFTN